MARLLLILIVATSGMSLAAQTERRQPRIVRLSVAGSLDEASTRGVVFGMRDAGALAEKAGASVLLEAGATSAEPMDGWLVAADAKAPVRQHPAIAIRLGPPRDGDGVCDYSLVPTDVLRRVPREVVWDARLVDHGAATLNERFKADMQAPMTSESWMAWFAIRTIVASALDGSTDRCGRLPTLKIDGHKGVPLSFDHTTRLLNHPRYIVEEGKIREIK